jgi:hypothetical protein
LKQYVRSPWIPAALIVGLSVAAYVERDTMRPQDKLVYSVLMLMLSVYVVEALTKRKH